MQEKMQIIDHNMAKGYYRKKGTWDTLNFCFDLGRAAYSTITSTDRAPFELSVTDHSLSGSYYSLRPHLHHMQE